MRNRKSGTKMSRRNFLNFTNKAGIALISAGGVLSIVRPEEILSAPASGGGDDIKGVRPIRNGATVTKKSRRNNRIVSSTLTFQNKDYLVNSEGSFIWNLCNGRHGLDMMAEALSLKYKKSPSIVEKDVRRFIDTLKSLNLVEFAN